MKPQADMSKLKIICSIEKRLLRKIFRTHGISQRDISKYLQVQIQTFSGKHFFLVKVTRKSGAYMMNIQSFVGWRLVHIEVRVLDVCRQNVEILRKWHNDAD